jgi:general secretion pathway protein N
MTVGLTAALSPLQRILAAVLVVAGCGFAAAIALEVNMPLDAPSGDAPAPVADPRPTAGDAPASFTLPPLQSFAAVTDRPLFSPDRRPLPQAAAESLGAWSSLILAGIIIAPDSRQALIVHGSPPTIVHLQEGQAVEGWTVHAILADRIVLVNGDDEHELRLLDRYQHDQGAHPAPSGSGR